MNIFPSSKFFNEKLKRTLDWFFFKSVFGFDLCGNCLLVFSWHFLKEKVAFVFQDLWNRRKCRNILGTLPKVIATLEGLCGL